MGALTGIRFSFLGPVGIGLPEIDTQPKLGCTVFHWDQNCSGWGGGDRTEQRNMRSLWQDALEGAATVPLTEWKWLSLSLRLVTGCGLSLESLRLGKDIIYCWARHSKDLMWYLQNMRWAVAGERSGMCIHLYVCLQAHEILRKDSVSLQRAMSLFQESNTKGRYLTLVWKLSCDIILCHKVGTFLIWYSQGQTFGRNMYILHNW